MAGVVTGSKRPRNLSHWHAGPLLFGDWGTSRLYVLGIGAITLGLAAPYYLLALSLLMVMVAWAYTIVCRSFQDGGGVYSAARQISPFLSVIGATLLLADYIVTAALSLLEAFRYWGAPADNHLLIVLLCSGAVGVLFVINWFGARSAGEFAKWIAVASLGLSAVVAVMVLPWVPKGFEVARMDSDPWLTRWIHFTGIILALSGVEAVANMTGIMKEPVTKTSKKTIWPVLAEVATLNLVFIIAIVGLLGFSADKLPEMNKAYEQAKTAAKAANLPEPSSPRLDQIHPTDTTGATTLPAAVPGAAADAPSAPGKLSEWQLVDVRDKAMKILAVETGQARFGESAGFVFGKIVAIVFGLLLISAANTVIGGMVSVMYALGRDGELPTKPLTSLNYSGMPKLPLILACLAPPMLLCVYYEVDDLAALYAIGVTGAIALNLSCCAFNRRLTVTSWERMGLWAVAVIITAVFITIAVTKPAAAIFCGGMIIIVQGVRIVKQRSTRRKELGLAEPEIGWLAELQRAPLAIDASKARIMLAARGEQQAAYAVDLARRRSATLFGIYVRSLRVIDVGASAVPKIENDPDAQAALGAIAVLARQYRVPFVPIYITSPEIAEEILDYTVTFGCDTLIVGRSQRSSLSKSLEGDVVGKIASMLPEGVSLITRDASPYQLGPAPVDEVIEGRRPEDRAGGDRGELDDGPERT
jgi:amino acid transporter